MLYEQFFNNQILFYSFLFQSPFDVFLKTGMVNKMNKLPAGEKLNFAKQKTEKLLKCVLKRSFSFLPTPKFYVWNFWLFSSSPSNSFWKASLTL